MPDGALETGMPAEAKDLAMTSFSAWWRWVRPGARLQTKACWPQAPTSSPQEQEWGTQMPRPKRRATATRTASSSKRNPQEAMGKALSQSPEWGAEAAKNVIIIIIIRNEYDYGGVMSEDC